jgi:hypothetical protein
MLVQSVVSPAPEPVYETPFLQEIMDFSLANTGDHADVLIIADGVPVAVWSSVFRTYEYHDGRRDARDFDVIGDYWEQVRPCVRMTLLDLIQPAEKLVYADADDVDVEALLILYGYDIRELPVITINACMVDPT